MSSTNSFLLLINPIYYDSTSRKYYNIDVGTFKYAVPEEGIVIVERTVYHPGQIDGLIATDQTISALITYAKENGFTILENPVTKKSNTDDLRHFSIDTDKNATKPYQLYYRTVNIEKNCGKNKAFLFACKNGQKEYVSGHSDIDDATVLEGLRSAANANHTSVILRLYRKDSITNGYIARNGNVEALRICILSHSSSERTTGDNLNILHTALQAKRYEFACIFHLTLNKGIEHVATEAYRTDKKYFNYLFAHRLIEPCIMIAVILSQTEVDKLLKKYRKKMEKYSIAPFNEWNENESTYLMNKISELGIQEPIFNYFLAELRFNKEKCAIFAAKKGNRKAFLRIVLSMDSIEAITDDMVSKFKGIRETKDNDLFLDVPIIKGRGFHFVLAGTEVDFWLDRHTIRKQFETQEQQDMRTWVAKDGRTIDDDGIGGEPSAEKVFLIPPRYYIDENTKNSLVSLDEGEFKLKLISHNVRIGTADGHIGVSQLHGKAPGVSFYRLSPINH